MIYDLKIHKELSKLQLKEKYEQEKSVIYVLKVKFIHY